MIEANIYTKIYDYVFKKTRDVWLTAENSWSSIGIWFVVCASISEKSFFERAPVWWGRRSPSFAGGAPMLTQMRVRIPKEMLLEMRHTNLPKPNDIIEVVQDEFGGELKCTIGKSICKCLKSYNELKITFGYDVVTLLDASSIEEMMIQTDLC